MSILSTPQALKSIYIDQFYEVLLGNIFTCKNFILRRLQSLQVVQSENIFKSVFSEAK